MTTVVAADFLAVNAAAVAFVPPLSLEALGPLALAFHDKQPHPVFLVVLVAVLLLGTWLPRLGRIAVLVFVGAVAANFLSPALREEGAPDYIVFREADVIANLSDLLTIGSAAIVALTVIVAGPRRRRHGRA